MKWILALLTLLLVGVISAPAAAQPFPYDSTGLKDPNGAGYGIPHTDGQPHIIVTSIPPTPPPAGQATEAKQDDGITALGNILAKLTADPSTDTELHAVWIAVSDLATPILIREDTAAIDAATAVTASVGATEAKQDDILTELGILILDVKDILIGQTDGTQECRAMWLDDEGSQVQPIVDHALNVPVVMSWAHHLVHEGKLFTVSDVDLDVDTGASKYWRFTTPADTEWHVACSLGVSQGSLIYWLEDPDIDAAGTQIGIFNYKRDAGDIPAGSSWFFKDTTFNGADDGDQIKVYYSGTPGGPGQSGEGGAGTARVGVEWYTEASTSYVIKVDVQSDNTVVTIDCDMYDEETL